MDARPDPASNDLSLEEEIVASIRRIMRAVELHSRRLFDAHGLTGPQLATLHEAARLAPTSPTAIARAVHLSQATVTGILQRLERQGLVSRSPSPTDRRGVVIEVTDRGRDALDRAPSLLQNRFRSELAKLENWERHQILAVLARVAALMDADQIDASPHLIPDSVSLPEGGDVTRLKSDTKSDPGYTPPDGHPKQTS